MSQPIKEEKVSITGLLKVIYRSKLVIAVFIICFVILGLVIYFLSPKEYVSRTVLLPESSNTSIGMGVLSSLAGINIGRGDSKDRTLNPAVYESIIKSSPFLDRIVSKQYYFPSIEKKMSLAEYLTKYIEAPVSEKITGVFKFNSKKSASPANSKISPVNSQIDTNKTEDKNINGIFTNTILQVSNRSAIMKLSNRLIYSSDVQNGLISLSLDLQDPDAGAEILQDMVSEFISLTMEYQGQKEDISIKQLDEQILRKKNEYNSILQRLANFKDRNVNVIRSGAQVEGQRLQNEMTLALGVYNSLLQQREQLSIQSNDKKSPISVIEPVQIASAPSSPNLILTLIISIFLGTLCGGVFVLSKKSLITIID